MYGMSKEQWTVGAIRRLMAPNKWASHQEIHFMRYWLLAYWVKTKDHLGGFPLRFTIPQFPVVTHYHKRCVKHRNYRSNERICTGIKTPFSDTSLGESLSVVNQISFVDVVKTSESIAGRKILDFELLDSKVACALQKALTTSSRRQYTMRKPKHSRTPCFSKKDSSRSGCTIISRSVEQANQCSTSLVWSKSLLMVTVF